MSQQLPEPEERLSRTLIGSLQNLAGALGNLSTVFASVGVISLISGFVLLIFVSDLRPYSYVILAIGGGLLLLSMLISYQAVGSAIVSRRGRYGTNTIIMVAAFMAIVGLANFLAFENSKRIDVTATKQFDLAPRTVSLLKNLEEPVEARAFFGPPSTPQEAAIQDQIEDMLQEFETRSSKFSYEFIDPDIDPLTAREYGLITYGNTVFESTESLRRHQVPPTLGLEQDFVTALLIITGVEQKQVYFLTDHGERDYLSQEEGTDGFGFAISGILGENYAVAPLNLSLEQDRLQLEKDIEDNIVTLLVIAGPEDDLLEGEAEILDTYLKSSGNMLILLEPNPPQSFREFFGRWGVEVAAGHIEDDQRSLPDNNQTIVLFEDQYFSQLPDPLDGLMQIGNLTSRLGTTYYPGVAHLEPADGVSFFPAKAQDPEEDPQAEDVTIIGAALGVTSFDSRVVDSTTTGDQLEGFLYPAVAIRAIGPLDEEPPGLEQQTGLASLVVFGDTDFASNAYFYDANNSDFFLNSINWLVGDIPLASIRPKPIAFRELIVTRNEFNVMRYTGWFLLPFMMALAGGFVWWKRR